MEFKLHDNLKVALDKNSGNTEREVPGNVQTQHMSEKVTEKPTPLNDLLEVHKFDAKDGPIDALGDVSMEASITADEVMRAGGFGARDDISSFLPVASDSTDFEASLRDARDYEDLHEEIDRPGLGWKGTLVPVWNV